MKAKYLDTTKENARIKRYIGYGESQYVNKPFTSHVKLHVISPTNGTAHTINIDMYEGYCQTRFFREIIENLSDDDILYFPAFSHDAPYLFENADDQFIRTLPGNILLNKQILSLLTNGIGDHFRMHIDSSSIDEPLQDILNDDEYLEFGDDELFPILSKINALIQYGVIQSLELLPYTDFSYDRVLSIDRIEDTDHGNVDITNIFTECLKISSGLWKKNNFLVLRSLTKRVMTCDAIPYIKAPKKKEVADSTVICKLNYSPICVGMYNFQYVSFRHIDAISVSVNVYEREKYELDEKCLSVADYYYFSSQNNNCPFMGVVQLMIAEPFINTGIPTKYRSDKYVLCTNVTMNLSEKGKPAIYTEKSICPYVDFSRTIQLATTII